MISVSLALSASVTGVYSARIALDATQRTLHFFLPLIIQSIDTGQLATKSIFDLHKTQGQAKKIDQEALGKFLESLITGHHAALMLNFSAQNKLNKDAKETLKTLTSLYKQI